MSQKQPKTIDQLKDLRRYRLQRFKPAIGGHVFPDSIVLVVKVLTGNAEEQHVLDAIELPRSAKPAALGAALMDAFSRQINITQGAATVPPDLRERGYYKEIELNAIEYGWGKIAVSSADRSQLGFGVEVEHRGLGVSGVRPDRHSVYRPVFSRTVDYEATAAELGSVVLDAIEAAAHAPEPRFSWLSLVAISARTEDYLLIYHHVLVDGEDAGCLVATRYELLDRGLGTKDLGAAVLDALLDVVRRPYDERQAGHLALLEDRRAKKILDQQESFPRVSIQFNAVSDPEHLELLAQEAHDNGSAGTARVPSDCEGPALGAALRKLFRKMGVEHQPAAPPPLTKLFGKYGYQALVVKGEGEAAVGKALEELRKLAMIKWSEAPGSQGPPVCAARLSESACTALDESLASLRSVAKRCRVAVTLVIANKTTDTFVFADLQVTKVMRWLQYGTQEQHAWSKVVGQPQAWEAKAFKAKRGTETEVRNTDSGVLITDAVKCAALAISAAYEQPNKRGSQ